MKVPINMNFKIVGDDGYATPEFLAFLSQLTGELQINFSDEGLVPPQQPPDNVAIIADAAPTNNPILVEVDPDTLIETPKIWVNGAFRDINYT